MSITDLSAASLSEAIHERDVSCREVMAAYLDRIDEQNPAVNAIVNLRDRVVERSNEAKRIQGRINQLAHLYVLDQLFASDLLQPVDERTSWRGTVMGLTRDKVHVTFEEPPVDVKLYIDDLEEQLRTKVELSDEGASLRRASGRGVCRIGEPVSVQVARWDPSRKRFVLRMDVD